ncbi:MAG: ester cyclase [Thermoleophilia bacterium]|nr:ester cyclase [Thermoleophilia bacterium]
MPSTAEIAEQYFAAVGRQDIKGMTDCWQPGKRSRILGLAELQAPEEIAEWFGNLFRAFPDFKFEVEKIISDENMAAIHWSAKGTFDGLGTFEGFKPTGARVAIEGIDVIKVEDGKIQSLVAAMNGLDLARQIGAVPPAGSAPDKALAAAFNAKTALVEQVKKLRS